MMKSIFRSIVQRFYSRSAAAILISFAILLQAGCVRFGSNDIKSDSYGNDFRTMSTKTYHDVVLVLDESSSHSTKRNEAADLFTQILTDSSSVNRVYFGKNLDLPGGMEKAFGLLKVSQKPDQDILLFIDGSNYDGKEKSINDRIHALSKKALTANSGNPVPIYVVYLGNTGNNLDTLRDSFSTEGHKAYTVDFSRKKTISDKAPWSDPSVNKIISTSNANALPEILSSLSRKMRNLPCVEFSDKKPESGKVLLHYNVPEFKTTRVQLVVTGKEKFKVISAFQGTRESYLINEKGASGEYKVITIDAKNDSFSPGQWEIEMESSYAVSGWVSLFSDFRTNLRLIQNGKPVSTDSSPASFTDTRVMLWFSDSSGKQLSPEGWNCRKINVGKKNFESMEIKDNAFSSQINQIEAEGDLPVNVALSYGDTILSVEYQIKAQDTPPVFYTKKKDCRYTDSRHIGGFVDAGLADDYVYDAKDKDNLAISVTDDTGDKAYIYTYSEMSTITNTNINSIPDNNKDKKHLFLSDRNGIHRVTFKASDSDGHAVTGEALIHVRSNAFVILSKVFLIFSGGAGMLIALLFALRKRAASKNCSAHKKASAAPDNGKNIRSSNTISKADGWRFLRSAFAMTLCLAILLQTGCGSFSSDREEVAETPEATETLPDQSDYDVILLLDESSSLDMEEKKMRNKAANLFIQMLTESSSVGTVFFGKNVNLSQGRDKLNKEETRKKYLSLLGTGKDARMYMSDDGTRQDKAIKQALKLLDGSNNYNQVILLFTDGISYNGKRSTTTEEKINEATTALAQKALTANKGDPIPIYVVYLDQDNGNKSKYLNTLRKTYSTKDHQAVIIDSPETNPGIWEQVPWSDTSVNKIICTDDPDELTEIFSKLLNKMRSLASRSFKNERPDKNNRIHIKYDVPEFKTTRVQLVVTGKSKFKVISASQVDDKESHKINEEGAAGEYKVINIDARKDSLASGQWDIEIESSSAVSGSVSLFSDFRTNLSFIQDGKSANSSVASFTDTEVKVWFTDSSGKTIKLGKGWRGDKITVGTEDFGPLKIRDNAFYSKVGQIRNEDELPVKISLYYGDTLYGIDSKILVQDAAPSILNEKKDCFYNASQHVGRFVDAGLAERFVRDTKDRDGVRINVADDSGDDAYICTYSEMACIADVDIKKRPDDEKHLFISDRSGDHDISFIVSDSDGHSVVGNTVISVRSAAAVLFLRILIALLCVAALLAALLFIHRRRYLANPRIYNVLVVVDSGAAIAPIPCMSDLHQRATLRIDLTKQKFFLKNKKYAEAATVQDLPFFIDAGDVIRLKLSAFNAFKAHLPVFRFHVEKVSDGGDKSTTSCLRSCVLDDPAKTYIVTYSRRNFRLSFSDCDNWNRIFTSFER